jgi:hypothetical protein
MLATALPIAAVEVIEGTHIQDFSWTEDTTPPNTSGIT